MSSKKSCCVVRRGDIYMGPAMNTDGKGYDDTFGWGVEWGISWGGFEQPMQPNGMAGMPASRYLGNANIEWTPNFKDIANPVRYTISSSESCATKILENISLSVTVYCRNNENEAMDFGAYDTTTVSASTVEDEVIYSKPGKTLAEGIVVPFARAPFDSTQPLFIQKMNTVDNSTTDLEYGLDYEYSMFGIKTKRAVQLNSNEVLIATYVSLAYEIQDSYKDCPITCSLLVEAKNLLDSCSSAGGQLYQGREGIFFPRVRLAPTGARTMFTDEIQAITLEGEAMPVWVNNREVRFRKFAI